MVAKLRDHLVHTAMHVGNVDLDLLDAAVEREVAAGRHELVDDWHRREECAAHAYENADRAALRLLLGHERSRREPHLRDLP